MKVLIPPALRRDAHGAAEAEVEATDVAGALAALDERFPGFAARILDGRGGVRPSIAVFRNGADVRFADGLATPLGDGDEVAIVPMIAGG